jgi:hypothetical protein
VAGEDVLHDACVRDVVAEDVEARLSHGGEYGGGGDERTEIAEPVADKGEADVDAAAGGEVSVRAEDEVARLGNGEESAEGVTADVSRGGGLAGGPVARGGLARGPVARGG